MPELKMPQLGESVVEGTITKWLKKEGDTVAEDELIVEISTDKVDSEVPSSLSGTLTKILVPEGETVSVGTPIAEIGGEGEAAQESKAEGEAPKAEAAPAEGEAEPEQPKAEAAPAEGEAEPEQPKADQAEGQSEKKEAESQAPAASKPPPPPPPPAPSQEQARRQESSRPSPPAPPSGRPATPGGDVSKRGIISPLVRRMADENDVNLDEIEGTGTGGRIRKQDVQRFIEQRKSGAAIKPAASAEPAPEAQAEPQREEAAAPARAPGEREELVPWTNIRRRTAEHMVASHLETARAWNAVEADWTNVVKLREQAKDAFKKAEGFNLTYMPFLARVVCETLLEMPEVNATFEEEQQANRIKRYVNLGIAVALEGGGLIVPVVKAADEKNLAGLARGINDVATRARSKKLSPDDLMGGTFTITNPGPFGSIISVPIIPRGQAAILGFEAIQKRVVVTESDAIAVRSMGFLSMSWDHRVIDGAEAAKFLARLRERIETTDFSGELSQFL